MILSLKRIALPHAMPSQIHESFLKNSERAVKGAIQCIVDGGATLATSRRQLRMLVLRVLLAEGRDEPLGSALRRRPDEQFQRDKMDPGVLIEVPPNVNPGDGGSI